MVGNLLRFRQNVPVANPSQWIIHCHVKKGGFPIIRHNELSNFTAYFLIAVCPNVAVEPGVQSLCGEELSGSSANRAESTRMDVVVAGFWGMRKERTSVDIYKLPRAHSGYRT